MRALHALLLGFIAITALAQPQTSSSVQGIVVKTGTDVRLSKAIVELRRLDATANAEQNLVSATDLSGVFRFSNVAAGKYRVIVTRTTYAQGEYGQRRPDSEGAAITIGPGQNVPDLKIELTPTGAISGRILDGAGRPLANATVQALKSAYQDQPRTLAVVKSIRTNDLGEYRLFWLTPGSYYVNVIVPGSREYETGGLVMNANGGFSSNFLTWDDPLIQPRPFDTRVAENESYVPIFFRGTPDANKSEAVQVRPEEDTGGIDIRTVTVRTVRVQGKVALAATNQAAASAQVALLSMDALQTSSYGVAADPANGAFTFPKVVPGRYAVLARATAPDKLFGYTVVDVTNQESANVTVLVHPPVALRGRIRIEGDSPLRDLTPLGVMLRMDPPIPSPTNAKNSRSRFAAPEESVRSGADGSFTIPEVPPAIYRPYVIPIVQPPAPLGATPPVLPAAVQNLYIKSIRLGQTDVLNGRLPLMRQPDEELEIVLGTNPGGIEGKASPGSTVVLLPDLARRFRTELERTAITDPEGRFGFQRLPPGDYVLFAWDDVEAGAWRDPDFIRRFENQGKSIQVREGSVERIQVSTIAP